MAMYSNVGKRLRERLLAEGYGELIRHLVEHHLAGAMLGRQVDALIIRKPPARLPSPRFDQERRRVQRRSRRQK
jgi:hypothetical protein